MTVNGIREMKMNMAEGKEEEVGKGVGVGEEVVQAEVTATVASIARVEGETKKVGEVAAATTMMMTMMTSGRMMVPVESGVIEKGAVEESTTVRHIRRCFHSRDGSNQGTVVEYNLSCPSVNDSESLAKSGTL